MKQKDILFEIELERARQDNKWGDNQRHPDVFQGASIESADYYQKVNSSNWKLYSEVGWDGILLEEVAEAIEEAIRGDMEALKEELTQCAAVIVAWLEDINSRA